MTITAPSNPLGDLSDGDVVTADMWNDVLDTLYDWLNNTLAPAVSALQSAPAPTVAAQGTFQARLTLQTGVPVPTVPQSAKGTMYLTNYRGNLVGIYDVPSLSWINRAFSVDISLAAPGGNHDLFDIWVSWNGVGLVLSATGYQNQACTNNPAAGANVVCNMASTAYFAVGDIVSISDGSNAEEARVTVVTAGVSITLDTLVSSYTAPTIHSNTPVEPTALQDGVLVKASDHGFRHVATVMVIANALNDTLSLRCVGNTYNRVERPFYHANTATSYSQASGINLANAVKTNGVSSTLFISAPGNMATSYKVSRAVAFVTGSRCELLEQIDGTMAPQAGYAPITGVPGAPNPTLNVHGAVLAGGRHTIVDWFNVASSSASIANIEDTLQCSYTTGSILN